MIDDKNQISLLRKVRMRRVKHQTQESEDLNKDYIRAFFNKHKLLILGTLALFLTQGIIETFLVIVGRSRLAYDGGRTAGTLFWQLLIILLTLFVVNSFFSIKQEKTIVVIFVNNLRRRIFRNYLGKAPEKMRAEGQADLVAKISYHLPLVSMGVSNSFFGLARWVIYLASASVVALLAGLNVSLIAAFFIVLSVIIALASYFTVKRYVSQEVTFFSQIIKHINLSLSEKYFSKGFNLEPVVMKKFDRLVDFDSIFRIRRDLWMKMGFKIVFAIVLVVSVLSNAFYGGLAEKINLIRPELKFLYVFLLIYLSRIITESLRIGLYFFPAKLGLSLTNVPLEKYLHRSNIKNIKSEIAFSSQKTKLFRQGRYYRNLELRFLRGGRYLFFGPNLSGKTVLAKLFFGGETYNSKALKVKIDGQRLDFYEYQRKFNQAYYFDPNFNSQKSLIEIITGSDREETAFPEIEEALRIMAAQPAISNLVSPKKNFNLSAGDIWDNHLTAFALHAAHCLVVKPALIIIDNLWLDLDYPGIKEMLSTISRELPESIIIVFAHKDIDNLNYDKRYDLEKNLKF